MTNHGLQKEPGFARSEIRNIAKLSKKEEKEEKKKNGVKYIVLESSPVTFLPETAKEIQSQSFHVTQFYHAAIESILTFSITVWYSSVCQKDKDQLQRIVQTASKIIGSDMKPIASIHSL